MSALLRCKGLLGMGRPRGPWSVSVDRRGCTEAETHSLASFSDCRSSSCLDFPNMMDYALNCNLELTLSSLSCFCESISSQQQRKAKPVALSDFPVLSVVRLGLELCLVLESGYFQHFLCDSRDFILFFPDSQC